MDELKKRRVIDLMNYFGTDKPPPKQLLARSLGVCPSIEKIVYTLLEAKGDGMLYNESGNIKTKRSFFVSKTNRLMEITNEIQQLLENNDVNIVVISTSRHSTETIAAVNIAADRCGVKTVIMTPQDVKSFLRLHGSAGADEIMQLASRIVGIDVHTTQSADAILCAFAGLLGVD